MPTLAPRNWAAGVGAFCLLAISNAAVAQTEPVKLDSETFAGLDARPIGPAVMSGRVASIDAVVEGGRLTVYVGSASGGVWKSVNGGTTFKPIVHNYTQSIGAVSFHPFNPKTILDCTVDSWVMNSVFVGDGV